MCLRVRRAAIPVFTHVCCVSEPLCVPLNNLLEHLAHSTIYAVDGLLAAIQNALCTHCTRHCVGRSRCKVLVKAVAGAKIGCSATSDLYFMP